MRYHATTDAMIPTAQLPTDVAATLALAVGALPRYTSATAPLPRIEWRPRAPQRLLDTVLAAMSSVAQDTPEPATQAMSAAPAEAAGAEPPEDDPDAALPRGPHAFDPGTVSMEDLVRDHADAVYRVALSVTRDASLAEDASQEALIKAWQALPSFRGDSPLRNWVLRITHNTAISMLRKRRDELRSPDELPEPVVHGSVEGKVEDRLAIGRFEEALADLDEVSRSIVVLREVEGLSYAELCEVLDLPMPTIKTRLLRARRQLAIALEGWQP